MRMLFFRFASFCLVWASLVSVGQAQSKRLRVIATTSFIADMASEIAGEYAEVSSLLPIGDDPHKYDPLPGEAQKLADSDLILRNGMTLEGWLDEMIQNSAANATVRTITTGVEPIRSIFHENAVDPHAWMDPLNAMIYAENIALALARIDPEHADDYQANYETYKQVLQDLHEYVESEIAKIPERQRILATSHDAFRYYGNRYGIRVESLLGTSTDAEVTFKAQVKMLQVLEENKVPSIFPESTIDPKLIRVIVRELGVSEGKRLFADSLGDKESGASTYVDMIRQNTDRIVSGLTRTAMQGTEESSLQFIGVILLIFALAFVGVAMRLRTASKEGLDWHFYNLEVKGLSVSYDRKTALSNIYLNIEPGFVYGLIGGNGSGKSTLFKSILGLVEPDTGVVSINGQEIDAVRKYISYIPQKEEIDWSFPATVMDVALMGRYPHRKVFERLTAEDRAKAQESLEMLGISDLRNKQIGELSGGQQQRVFLARALCQEAEVYLFDEPFVGVDMTTEARIIEIVKELAARGKMVIIIHHDLAKVKDYFDRLIMVNQRIVAVGDTEAVFTDENLKKTYGGRLTILQKTENYL